jgi:hypothetical protein
MPGALDQYLQDFQKYVSAGRAAGIKPKVELPVKPVLEPSEEAAVKVLEDNAKSQPAPVIPVTFNSEAFHAQVLAKVKPKYTVENPATIAYQASDLGLVTPAYSLEEVRGYADYLLALYEGAFAWVWGYGYQQAMDEVGKPGCPKCSGKPICGYWSLEAKAHYMGMEYYVVLLQLEGIIKVRGEFIEYAGHTTWQQVRRRFDRQPSLQTVLNIARM